MTFNKGDVVQYGLEGVCTIEDIVKRPFRDEMKKYYVLHPVFNANATLYVPFDNEVLVGRMRYTLTEKDFKTLIKKTTDADCAWIPNEAERKVRYKEIIHGGDRKEIVALMKTLYIHKEEQASLGKKMHVADEKFFNDAERIIFDEFAVAMGITPNEVLPYMEKLFNK